MFSRSTGCRVHTRVFMNAVFHPWQLLAAILAGWVNRDQQQLIDYLRTENQINIAATEKSS